MTVDDPGELLAAVRWVAGETGTRIVLFDAEKMAGRAHAEAALAHAARSWARGDPIARTFEMEALLLCGRVAPDPDRTDLRAPRGAEPVLGRGRAVR